MIALEKLGGEEHQRMEEANRLSPQTPYGHICLLGQDKSLVRLQCQCNSLGANGAQLY